MQFYSGLALEEAGADWERFWSTPVSRHVEGAYFSEPLISNSNPHLI